MGFSLSCFASHQTIAERDLCRVIPVFQSSPGQHDTVHHQGKTLKVHAARSSWSPHVGWEPVGELIQVRAVGYGRVTLHLTPQCRRKVLSLLHHLASHMPVIEPQTGRESLLDIASLLEKYSEPLFRMLTSRTFSPLVVGAEYDEVLSGCWTILWEALCRNRLFVQDILGRIRPMEFALIHEDAYQALVTLSMSKPRRDGTPAPVDISAAIRHNLDAAREIGNSVSDGECDARTTMFICASIFADKMVDVAASSQKLSLLKAHFSAVGRAVFMAAMPDEEAVRLLHDDVKDIYAVAGMDSLGIGFSPITLAADEDYDNHNGRNYLNFISTVCRMTDRSRMAAKFGDFQTYQFLAASQQDLQKLVTASRNWDCGFELVSSKPVREGQSVPLKAMVDTTLTLEELQLLLDEVKLPFMRDSVKLVSN